jgi:hypothetical protein
VICGGAVVLLADEFFCIAHDDRTGRAHLSPRVLGLGLAAGLLGELVLFGRIDLADREIRVERREPPPDALAHATLEQILAQPHRDLRTCLAHLSGSAVGSVANRLTVAGTWQRREQRRLGRARVGYLPIDVNTVAWRSMRLARLLISPEPIGHPDAVLAGLVAATNLTSVVLWQPDSRAAGAARIDAEVARLPWSLYHLLAFTLTAVGDTALTLR